ncbi:MAG: ArnT family glycosyltransferase [Haloechinothrix sp.]
MAVDVNAGDLSTPARWVRWGDTHARAVALCAVALSVALAGGYALVLGDILRFADEQEYLELTRALAEGQGYAFEGQPTAYRPPGLPLLLAPVHAATGGSILALRLVGVFALAASVWLAYLLGRRMHSPSTGALAAVATGCYPLFVYTATTLYPQVPAMALLLGFIEASLRVADAGSGFGWRWVLAAGLAGGILVLTVPTLALSIPVVLGWICWQRRGSSTRTRLCRALAAVAALAILVPGAWTARNAFTMGAFVPISTNSGVNLLLGNSGNVTADSGSAGDIVGYYEKVGALGLDEVEANRFYTHSALDWVRAHPGQAARLYAEKVVHTFAYSNDFFTTGRGNSLRDIVSAVTFYPVLTLALVRLALARWRPLRPEEQQLAGLIIVNVLLLAVFFTRIRLRLPVDGMLIILASSATMQLLALRVRRRRAGSAEDPVSAR